MEVLNESALLNVSQNHATRKDFLSIIKAGIASVDAYTLVRKILNYDGAKVHVGNSIWHRKGRVFVLGAGKVAHHMASACVDEIEDCTGVVLCPVSGSHGNVKFLRCEHPLAGENNLKNTETLIDILRSASQDDLVLFMISGGASAMLAAPLDGLSIDEKNAIVRKLMLSGADIKELNTVRKHLSRIKGGKAALLTEARILGLVLSDVPEGSVSDIGSGPTAPDWTKKEDAIDIMKRYGIWENLKGNTKKIIESAEETPKFDNPCFRTVRNYIIGDCTKMAQACAQRAEELGYEVHILTTALDAEARESGKLFAEILNQTYIKSQRRLFVAAGETTVNVRGNGRGGRNLEVVMGFLKKLNVKDGVILAFATDGKDGTTPWAGAFGDANTIACANKNALSINDFLSANNSMEFFEKTGDFITVNDTRTNVGDLIIFGYR